MVKYRHDLWNSIQKRENTTMITTMEEYNSRIKQVLITEEEIRNAVKEAAKKIDALYDGHPILLVSVLKGAFVFLADLARAVTVPCEIGFMCAKSYYSSTESSGVVKITMDLDQDVSQYHLVIVEDIIDTGRTLHSLIKMLETRDPISLSVVTLLDKPSRRKVDLKPDYCCFEIEDLFVVGYGLDYEGFYRNVPYVFNWESK